MLQYSDLILVASVASLSFATALYYFNLVSRNERGIITYREEVKTIILNLVLLLVIAVGWDYFDSLASNFLQKPKSSFVDLAISKIDDNIINPFLFRMYDLVSQYIPPAATVSSISVSNSVSFVFRAIGFKVGGSFQTSSFSILLDKLLIFYSSIFDHLTYLSGLKQLMLIFEFFSIKFFIPLGIFFRTFSLTRKLGSTMVAIGIGAGLVLPMTVVLASDITNSLLDDNSLLGITALIDNAKAEAGALNSLLSYGNFINGFFRTFAYFSRALTLTAYTLNITALIGIPIISDVASIALTSLINGVKAVSYGGLMSYITGNQIFLVDSAFSSRFFPLFSQALIGFTVGIFMFYFVVALVVISFIRSLSIILGGEFFLYGVERLI